MSVYGSSILVLVRLITLRVGRHRRRDDGYGAQHCHEIDSYIAIRSRVKSTRSSLPIQLANLCSHFRIRLRHVLLDWGLGRIQPTPGSLPAGLQTQLGQSFLETRGCLNIESSESPIGLQWGVKKECNLYRPASVGRPLIIRISVSVCLHGTPFQEACSLP